MVAAIPPWNHPRVFASYKLAPVLAAGCTVVLKGAADTALDALVFAEAAAEAGVPWRSQPWSSAERRRVPIWWRTQAWTRSPSPDPLRLAVPSSRDLRPTVTSHDAGAR